MSDWTGPTAYGLRLSGMLLTPDLTNLLPNHGAAAWPEFSLSGQAAPVVDPGDDHILDHHAQLPCLFGGHLLMRRSDMTAVFTEAKDLDAHVLAHPGLAGVGLVAARWFGRLSLHAGAVQGRDGAWVLVGAKGAGKTTTLAMLARRGYGILADDLVILERDIVLPGPQILDLRPAAEKQLRGTQVTVIVRSESRHRVVLPAVGSPHGVPLAGIIYLRSSRSARVDAVPLDRRLAHLPEGLALRPLAGDAERLLPLLAAPTYHWRRPLWWAEAERSLNLLEELIGPPTGTRNSSWNSVGAGSTPATHA